MGFLQYPSWVKHGVELRQPEPTPKPKSNGSKSKRDHCDQRGRNSSGMRVLDNQELIRPARKLLNRGIHQARTVPPESQRGSYQKPAIFAQLESTRL
jgi:hypothetical protein